MCATLHRAHDHARSLEHLQMLRDRWLRDPETARRNADRRRATSQPSRVWRIIIMRGGQQMSVVLSG